ncbi:MAG: TIGR03557 family F420-dependent LLM class oxidoreductase [Actinobacteria bacterium]|nr:TIGR03557 family F420-dependent LLM class oxidoreductase [Actinomycetota bacterium]
MSVKWGFTLSSEEHSPARLVEIAQLGEGAGFDFLSISDHYHPWVSEQGHASFVWSVLGAIGAQTKAIKVAVGVTCPIIRIHPAVLAQAVATTSSLLDGRFVWGVGTGENLNEHILGDRWPPHPVRLEMLEEALEVIRRLWDEESVTHYGNYYTVEDARIFDRPQQPTPIVVSAFGPETAQKAAAIGDGLWTSGSKEVIDEFRNNGGKGDVYSQLTLCWGDDEEKAKATAHRLWAFSGLTGQLNQDLRTIAEYEAAVKLVTPAALATEVPCGPNVEPIVEKAAEAIAAGVDHLYFHQIGSDQEGFLSFWDSDLKPALARL